MLYAEEITADHTRSRATKKGPGLEDAVPKKVLVAMREVFGRRQQPRIADTAVTNCLEGGGGGMLACPQGRPAWQTCLLIITTNEITRAGILCTEGVSVLCVFFRGLLL